MWHCYSSQEDEQLENWQKHTKYPTPWDGRHYGNKRTVWAENAMGIWSNVERTCWGYTEQVPLPGHLSSRTSPHSKDIAIKIKRQNGTKEEAEVGHHVMQLSPFQEQVWKEIWIRTSKKEWVKRFNKATVLRVLEYCVALLFFPLTYSQPVPINQPSNTSITSGPLYECQCQKVTLSWDVGLSNLRTKVVAATCWLVQSEGFRPQWGERTTNHRIIASLGWYEDMRNTQETPKRLSLENIDLMASFLNLKCK